MVKREFLDMFHSRRYPKAAEIVRNNRDVHDEHFIAERIAKTRLARARHGAFYLIDASTSMTTALNYH